MGGWVGGWVGKDVPVGEKKFYEGKVVSHGTDVKGGVPVAFFDHLFLFEWVGEWMDE